MKVILALLFLIVICQSYKPELKGEKWQSKSAQEKFQFVSDKIKENTTPSDWYLLKMATLFIQDNSLSFTSVEDDMPAQGFLNRQKRDKLIHTVGLHADVSFEPTANNKYTGILKGSKHAIMRFSSAAKPDGYVTPGFTFKFFRDGIPSANLFSMFALTGQAPGDSSIFQNDMSSHVPFPNSDAPLPIKLLKNNFEKVSDWANILGLSDLCAFTESGEEETELNFPFRLQLHPTKEAKASMSNDLEIKGSYYIDAMQGVKIDTVFDVYAQGTPFDEHLELIGHIKMNSAFTSSKYGDETFFVEHQFFEDDLKIKPEWEAPAAAINDKQENTFPQYTYPNIRD